MNAPILARARAASRQRGVAAVELAVILSGTALLMLPALAFCVFTYYQFSVIKTACADAAAHMASLPRATFMTSAQRTAASAVAVKIVADAAGAAGIADNTWLSAATVSCSGNGAAAACNSVVPATVAVEVSVELDVMGFDVLYDILPYNPVNKLTYTVRAVAPYVN